MDDEKQQASDVEILLLKMIKQLNAIDLVIYEVNKKLRTLVKQEQKESKDVKN